MCSAADDSEEENLESDLGQVGTHAFARMEADVDKQRKQILQGHMSEAAVHKQHQRKYSNLITTFLLPFLMLLWQQKRFCQRSRLL